MDNKVNYAVVGLFVIVLSIILLVMVFWLSSKRHDKVYNTYMSYAHDDVTGLNLQSPVRFNGVQVGYVSGISLDPNNPQLVKLVMEIEQGTPVTTSTVVSLLPMGITGVVYVGLKAKTPHAPLLQPQAGEGYAVIPFQQSFLMQLSSVLPEIANDIKKIGNSINDLLNEKNRKAISDSLENISVITKNLSENSKKIDSIMKSVNITLKNTADASKQFPEAIKSLKAAMNLLEKTSINVNLLTQKANVAISDSQVTIDSINNQMLPNLQRVLVRFDSMMLNFQEVAQQLQRNPSMFIRGRQPIQPGPGENH